MIVLGAAVCQQSYAATDSRTFYLDFGATPQGANKCELTVSPDANGNHWNNITNTSDGSKYAAAGTVFEGLIDNHGADATLTVTLNDRFSTNGMSGGGGLLAPSSDLLGDLAVATATADYYFYEADQSDCAMTFGGLDPDKAYRFHIFASRSAADNRTGIYRLNGYNLWSGNLQAAGSNLGGAGVNQNNSTILVSDYVFADADGNIKLTILRASGTYIPLNCMKIEEVEGVDRPSVNNYVSLSLEGSAVDGRKVVLTQQQVDNRKTNVYEGAADLGAGEYYVVATDEKGIQHTFGVSATDGRIAEGGAAFVSTALPTMFTIDLDALTCTTTALENIRLIGSAVGSWSLTDYKEMTYAGNLLYTWEGELQGHDTSTDSGRVCLYINGSWTAFKRSGVDADYNAVLSLGNGADIPINPGKYKMHFDLATGVLKVENGLDSLDPARITVFGSSVANGQGADQIANENHGYMHLFGNILDERTQQGVSAQPFYVSNISIGGNSTVMLLDRYDDMRREFGKYVVFGVSLGNEGVHEATDKQAVYNQFKTNMLQLIDMVRADGKVPVVCNNYTRGDFTADDYRYILDMDREIGLWDVPSINLLGAIDSKTGMWADGYQNGTDIYHPNQAGHQEFAYAMVPSLFDALESGKVLQMQRLSANGMTLAGQELSATPEGTMHSFAFVTVGQLPVASGKIVDVKLAENSPLSITYNDGKVSATLAGRNIEVAAADDASNSMVAVSYTYSSGILDLTVYDGETLCGTARMSDVKIEPVEFSLTGSTMMLREAMLYRSALSAQDIESLANGELQKSSLEIYSTFDETAARTANYPATGNVVNHAMSTNSFVLVDNGVGGVSNVTDNSCDAPVRYYTVQGIEALQPVSGQLYIAVTPVSARKIVY